MRRPVHRHTHVAPQASSHCMRVTVCYLYGDYGVLLCANTVWPGSESECATWWLHHGHFWYHTEYSEYELCPQVPTCAACVPPSAPCASTLPIRYPLMCCMPTARGVHRIPRCHRVLLACPRPNTVLQVRIMGIQWYVTRSRPYTSAPPNTLCFVRTVCMLTCAGVCARTTTRTQCNMVAWSLLVPSCAACVPPSCNHARP